MVKTISTPRTMSVILLNIKINQPKLVHMCEYKLIKCYGIIHSLSENIAKKFYESTFFTYTVDGSRTVSIEQSYYGFRL